MWALVGLGNPGKEYAETRHNVGFRFVKKVAGDWNLEIKKRKFLAKTAETRRDGETIILALPQTYMNRSGDSVAEILSFYKIPPGNLLVVYDDLDIPLGEIRVRKGGSAGSHKGMLSIVEKIATTGFPRIRVGIGPHPPEWDAADFVLSRFSGEEKSRLERSLADARLALDMILAGGIDKAMTAFNQRVQES